MTDRGAGEAQSGPEQEAAPRPGGRASKPPEQVAASWGLSVGRLLGSAAARARAGAGEMWDEAQRIRRGQGES